MIIDYKPEDKDYEGTIKWDVPSYAQRLNYSKQCNYEIVDGQFVYSAQNIDGLLKALELAKDHVKEVNLKRKSDGREYKSYDDLLMDADEVCQELQGLVLSRPSLGKSSAKK